MECDLLVVGGGPGGYTAAIRGAQKGLNTVLVERGHLGGTCLNRGCIPTKTLLEDTLTIAAVRNSHFMRGDMKINLGRMLERKNMVVEGSRDWIRKVLSGNGVTVLPGEASFTGRRSMAVKTPDGNIQELSASRIVLATGAQADYGCLKVDGSRILSTDEALMLKSIPKTLAVVGAGNRGMEFASIYHNLGVKVVVIEKERRILPRVHWELSDRYKQILLERHMKFLTGATVVGADAYAEGGVVLHLETGKGQQEIQVDKVLATGVRRPDYQGLNLEAAGLSGHGGVLEYDAHQETRQSGIYVIGDAAGPPYLAHKAIFQAMAAVDHMVGADESARIPLVPNCVYGDPEIASVGMTEDQALQQGRRVKVGEFHFIGNGRAGTTGKVQGVVIMVSDAENGIVLGVHAIGPQATELISLASLAMANGMGVAEIRNTVFPHPSLSEAFFEAALATDNQAIHLLLEGEEHGLGD